MEGFTEGSTVEVWSREDGFQNAWFSAVILEPPSHTLTPSLSPVKKKTKRTKNDSSKVVVRYLHMLADDGKRHLVERIDSYFVRPNPPPDTEPDKPFAQNDVVDAFHHDIWWTGVIINVENDNYTVRFAIPPDLLYCNRSQLRPHWDWVDKKWVRSGKQEIKYSKFRPGTGVEVKLSTENEGLAWIPAVVIGEIEGSTSVLVKYKTTNKDYAEKVSLVQLEMIRLQPPKMGEDDKDFELWEKVDAICDLGWSVGEVTKILQDRKYVVAVAFGVEKKEMEFDHTQLRYHLDWVDGKWVNESRENLSTPVSRQKSTCDEGRGIGSSTLNGSLGCVTEKETSCSTNVHDNQMSPGVDNSSTFELEELQLSTAGKGSCAQMVNGNDNLKSNQVEELDDPGRLGEPQKAPVFEKTSGAASSQEGGQNDNGAICEIDRYAEQTEDSNVQGKGSPQNLPVVKRSTIWELVDSLEVFKKLPQNPQCHLVMAGSKIELEVLALTNKVKFAFVIDQISNMQEATTTDTVDSIIEQLTKLQNMGFDVELLKNYLNEFNRLKLGLKDVKTKLMDHIGCHTNEKSF
ncbi:DUF724 domain-containing protein 7-like [Humulus lupulus]|uniref:DUF724 domain-containing protein 7-like n=1 Tax=Humulus lupulus TaxID=3486 RepID=UPI002B418539|nr:DUF724 domain-containing protein 7-like [Humulus lupulus]